jgi:hypothetical protein
LVHIDEKKVFFLNGEASDGKTYLFYTMVARIGLEAQIVISMASLYIVSFLLNGGQHILYSIRMFLHGQ